jgi:hypothetical protein
MIVIIKRTGLRDLLRVCVSLFSAGAGTYLFALARNTFCKSGNGIADGISFMSNDDDWMYYCAFFVSFALGWFVSSLIFRGKSRPKGGLS